MKRLLTSTAALSIAIAPVNPWPLLAQTLTEQGTVVAEDGTVLCEPTAEKPCVLEDYLTAAPEDGADQGLTEEEKADRKAKRKARKEAEAEAQGQTGAEAGTEGAVQTDPGAVAPDEVIEEGMSEDEKAARKAKREARKAAEAAAEAEAQGQADVETQTEGQTGAQTGAETDVQTETEAADEGMTEEEKAARKAKREARKAAEAAAEAAGQDTQEGSEPATGDVTIQTEGQIEGQTEGQTDVQTEGQIDVQTEGQTEGQTEATGDVSGQTATEAPAEDQTAKPLRKKKRAQAEKSAEDLAAEAQALEQAQQELEVDASGTIIDPAAGLQTEQVAPDPDAQPVEAPQASDTQIETLTDILTEPEAIDPTQLGAAAAVMSQTQTQTQTGEQTQGGSDQQTTEQVPVDQIPPAPDAVDSVTTVLTQEDTRTSSQEFAPPPVQVAPGQRDRLSDLEKVGLVALGALAVGAIIKSANDRAERQVVSNTGDRVVVLNPDGSYSVYKDDDTVLRRPGSTVRTETFRDGSTRTIVERTDGSQVVTIRDATGRVLRRAAYDRFGREMVLIDDLVEEVPVVVTELPPPREQVTISAKDEDALLAARLAAREAAELGRTFSLRQVREIAEVRALAATIDAGNVTFDSGSAAIKADKADELADLGALMKDLLAENPSEVFLIEGHTDAVGKTAMNLALSDRRAESVALALTEYFDIPPENMVVQGYGESELLIDTEADERRNRRVAVRVITPLLRTAAN